jgi:hypothetical protein
MDISKRALLRPLPFIIKVESYGLADPMGFNGTRYDPTNGP